MRNIYLIGFMGAGKSAVVRQLCSGFGMEPVEMDAMIEQQEGRSISEIFRTDGESRFRELETDLLRNLSGTQNRAVSCGGGAVLREENIALMKQGGTVIFLTASPQTIYDRVKDSHNRPLLEGNMNVPFIASLLEKRMPMYLAAADRQVDTDGRTVTEICREIMQGLREETV